MKRLFSSVWLKNVGLGILVFIIFVVFAEWVLRFFVALEPIEADPILRFHARLDAGGWDSRGFRNDSALATATIVAFGDSQTYGNNATTGDAWPQQLGAIVGTPAYQMAIQGYGPVQYDALLDDALLLKPKIVIAGFYYGNDLEEAYDMAYNNEHWSALRNPNFTLGSTTPAVTATDTPNYRLILQTGLEPGSLQYKIYQIRLWTRAHSVLYARLGDLTRAVRERIGIAKTRDEKLVDIAAYAQKHPDVAFVLDDSKIGTIMSPQHMESSVDFKRPETREGWEVAQGRFLDMAAKAKKADATFVVAVLPAKEEVYLNYLAKKNGKVPDQYAVYAANSSAFNALTRAFCLKNHIDCIFVLDDLVAGLLRGDRVYGATMDGHPKPLGYYVEAQSITRGLESFGLLNR